MMRPEILREDYYRRIMPRIKMTDFDPNVPGPDTMMQWTLSYMRPTHLMLVEQLALKLWEPDMAGRLVDQCEEMFRNRRHGPKWWVITSGDVLAGFTGLRQSWMVPKGIEFIGVDVDPEYQGNGFGRLLNRTRLEFSRAVGAEYVMVNTIQPGFFRLDGFQIIDQLTDGWFIMRKEL